MSRCCRERDRFHLLCEIPEQIIASGQPLLTADEIEREIDESRQRFMYEDMMGIDH